MVHHFRSHDGRPFPAISERKGQGSQAIARLQQHTGIAGTILLKLMTDPNVPAAVRLRAAESVIAHAIKRDRGRGYRDETCGARRIGSPREQQAMRGSLDGFTGWRSNSRPI